MCACVYLCVCEPGSLFLFKAGYRAKQKRSNWQTWIHEIPEWFFLLMYFNARILWFFVHLKDKGFVVFIFPLVFLAFV